MDEADQTANVNPTMRTDINGEKCALIKIATTQKNFSFDVGSLGITATEWQNTDHPGEIWLYVPNGVMKISIQHPQFGSIKDYDLGGRLKKGRTYVMDLTSNQVNTLVVDYDNSQILDIDITPHDANLYINGLKQRLDFNGHASITLPFGTHNYRVVANNYHPEESKLIINDKENKHQLSVRLKQAFGYLTVKSTPESNGGEIYIDDVRVGTLPISKFPLKSGLHQISIHKKLYFPYSEMVIMKDSANVEIIPSLRPNFSEYEIFVDGDKDAKIYDNGELLAIGQWRGYLEAGEHIIEAKKTSHTTIKQKINVVKDTPRKVSISKPMPIYGILEVKTTPSNAQVYIDGSDVGITNFVNNKILIGSHIIKIVKSGYKTEEIKINISKKDKEIIDKTLNKYFNLKIISDPIANVYINGNYKGLSPTSLQGEAGDYLIKVTKNGYSDYYKKLYLDWQSNDLTIKLHKKKYYHNIHKFEGDLLIGYVIGASKGLAYGLDVYLSNINIGMSFKRFNTNISFYADYYDNGNYEYNSPFTYKANIYNFNVGYGFKLSGCFRLTPKFGFQLIDVGMYKDDQAKFSIGNFTDWNNKNLNTGNLEGRSAKSLNIGVRLDYAFINGIGIYIIPGYCFKLSTSSPFDKLTEVCSSLRNYSNGFYCNFGIYLFKGKN